MLEQGVDWTAFARPPSPTDSRASRATRSPAWRPIWSRRTSWTRLRTIVPQTERENRVRFEELGGVFDALAANGVEAIAFKGPVLALRAYGNLGLRAFRDLDFLVRDQDLVATIATLRRFGYERGGRLTEAFELIHRLQGQEIIFNKATGAAIEPHTRLTGLKLAFDIDYGALWRRAQHLELHGRTLLVLAPEDDLIALAVHGGKEVWWNIKWVCDIAAFITAYPSLDWTALLARARQQGCQRAVLLATALARRYFDAVVPETVIAAETADSGVEYLVGRIAGGRRWVDETMESPTSKTISLDRLLLHDGFLRRTRYVARTLFLPGPHHVEGIPLPRSLQFAYVSNRKLVHDSIALPLWRFYRRTIRQLERWQSTLTESELALAWLPVSSERRAVFRAHGIARAEAERELATDPKNAAAWRRLGDALAGLKRHKRAIACYDRALEMAPNNTVVWKRRAAALAAVGGGGDVVEERTTVTEDADAWGVRAGRLFSTQRFAEAIEASDQALALEPGHPAAVRVGIRARLFACDWRRREEDKRQISAGVRAGKCLITPFFHRAISASEAENLALARLWARRQRQPRERLCSAEPYRHGKLRIAYMSTDFRDHVVSDMIVGCFEQHDRTRLEVTAVSLGPKDRSAMRARIVAAFERFVDGHSMSDIEVARRIRAGDRRAYRSQR